ncbi:aspartic proteinase CDR1-like [Impatiens glandulifera]|uniref:aspartic proteinase CDR1-like n=1 Tax=Impatiens glandulifera TaxID=253017 RepID=UPI001FB088AA|nr:aspartic proteinase CDR1-like [Impatiens glandulifera]
MFDSFVSQTNLLERTIRRSRSRLSNLKSILKLPVDDHAKETSDIESTLEKTDVNHLMEIFVGTPPVKQLVAIDTASDNIWTQCLPCINCYEQNQPKFNSRNSLTYNVLRCDSPQCKALGRSIRCFEDTHKCEYEVTYFDDSTTSGDLALETFIIGNTLLPNMVYGCSNANKGQFDINNAGVIGLGHGPLSLVSQLDHLIGGKFSYCLMNWIDRNTKSKISFGANANVYGHGTVSTKLFAKSINLYFVALEAVTVENTRILFKSVTKSIEGKKDVVNEGNMMIDVGSILSYLPIVVYQELENAFKSVIQAIPLQNPLGDFKLCYKNSSIIITQIPRIIFHLAGGANLALTSENTVVQYEDIICLGILPDNDVAVLGQFLQMNYLIGYDLKKGRIFFKSTDCSTQQII